MILIVDRDPAAREILRRLLIRKGCQPAFAGTVAEARAAIAANTRSVRVALVDLALADDGALDLLRQLRELDPNVKLVACVAEPSAVEPQLPVGTQILRKPFEFDSLIESLC